MPEFRIQGLEEFQEKLKLIERRAPDRILDKLDDEGKKLVKAVRGNMPKKTGKLRKGVKALPVEKVRGGYQKGVTNKSPHYHLVERGHRKISKTGQELGWVDGKFYLERTVTEQEDPIMNELKNWLDDLFQELSR